MQKNVIVQSLCAEKEEQKIELSDTDKTIVQVLNELEILRHFII